MTDTAPFRDNIITSVLAEMPGIELAFVERNLRWVVYDALRRTKLWQGIVTITTTPGERFYELEIAEGVIATEILWARMVVEGRDGEFLSLGISDDLDSGPIRRVGLPTASTIAVSPIPTGVQTFRVKLVLSIDVLSGAAIPAEIEPHYEMILFGLRARLHAMPEKPWTDAGRALFNLRSFNSAVAECSALVRSERNAHTAAWRFPRFGR
jgi:hypothetical protein